MSISIRIQNRKSNQNPILETRLKSSPLLSIALNRIRSEKILTDDWFQKGTDQILELSMCGVSNPCPQEEVNESHPYNSNYDNFHLYVITL